MLVAASTDMGGVNELLSATGSFTQSVLRLMFLQLPQEQPDFDQHPPPVAPELAEQWAWSADGKILTLSLRQDVRWTNGAPVTAADVEWTWLAQTHEDVAWGHADAKGGVAKLRGEPRQLLRDYLHLGVSELRAYLVQVRVRMAPHLRILEEAMTDGVRGSETR